MKTTKTINLAMGLATLTMAAFLSGCVVTPYGGVAVEAPPPAVSVDVDVYPDDYWWDGYEYVGIVGGRYYYLGPGSVWIVCEPFRVERFEAWEHHHPDWRVHATPNERFRPADRGHDRDRDRGRGRGHGHED